MNLRDATWRLMVMVCFMPTLVFAQKVNDFPKARKPAYQLTLDFGALGIKKSSAQITDLYTKEELLNKQVAAIINFKPRQIANFMSECLVIGVYNTDGNVVLLQASKGVKNGEKVS